MGLNTVLRYRAACDYWRIKILTNGIAVAYTALRNNSCAVKKLHLWLYNFSFEEELSELSSCKHVRKG